MVQATDRTPLSRERILETAVQVADTEGLHAFSMRRLAKELGVDPMAIYYHIPNKAALVRGVLDTVLAEVMVPLPHGDAWHERLRTLAHAYRQVARRHPHILPALVAAPGLEMPPQGYAILEVLYTTLLDAGLETDAVVHASTVLFTYVTGFVLAESAGLLAAPTPIERNEMEGLPHNQFPATQQLMPYLSTANADSDFAFGIDTLIAGIRTFTTNQR